MARTVFELPQIPSNTLGYAQITGSFSTASTNAVQITGLSTAVTVPIGGRRVKITVYSWAVTNTSTGIYTDITIWDGTVGSGTQVGQAEVYSSGLTNIYMLAETIITPSAGNHTYNAGLNCTAGTSQVNGKTSAPAFILVELI